MPVYTKLYGLFFLIICVAFYCLAYMIRNSDKRSIVSRALLMGADLFFYAYAGLSFIPALLYVVIVTYVGGLLLEKRKKLLPLFCVLLFAPLIVWSRILLHPGG